MLLRAVALSALVLTSACGGGSDSPTTPTTSTVEYRVEGVPRASLITIANADGGTSQFSNVTLPWTRTMFSLPAGQFVYVSAQNDGTTGCIRVQIIVRSAVFKDSQSCGAFVIASASGSI